MIGPTYIGMRISPFLNSESWAIEWGSSENIRADKKVSSGNFLKIVGLRVEYTIYLYL